jgi:hypothetical protein
MGKEILKTNIKRESGMLYYCGTDSNGCIVVCEAKMSRGGKKKATKKPLKKVAKKNTL